ncbi:MAG: hypothetical protein KIT09_26480 [Bryobacteraceae bacterium]|nr:hypothetical protein [Bryobacteraceae bacterium]
MTSIFYLVSVFVALKNRHASKADRCNWTPILIVGAAVVFRLSLWGLEPQLSDDAFRYRWEGKLQAAGGNPYQAAPADPEWSHLRDPTFPRVSGSDLKASYGPLVELIEWGMYHLVSPRVEDPFRQAFWFKLPAALFDAALIGLLFALLRARGLPAERLVIYAWSPLPIVEFWATGHNDAVMLFFLVGGLWLAARDRWTPAFASLTLAGAAKLWPFLLFPLFVGWKRWRPLRWYQWLIAIPIAGALALPYWSDVGQNVRVATGFLGGWRNNDSIFGLLLWLAGDQYPAKYAAFAIVGAAVVVVTLLRWPLEKAALTVIAVMLMVSANCHPWYLTWMLPLLAFSPQPALLLWTALAPLAYRVVIAWTLLGEWNGSTPFRWHIYVPVYGLLVATFAFRWWRARRQSGA